MPIDRRTALLSLAGLTLVPTISSTALAAPSVPAGRALRSGPPSRCLSIRR